MELKITKVEIGDMLMCTEEKVQYLRDKEKEGFGIEYLTEKIEDFLPDEKRESYELQGVVSYYTDTDNFQELVELYEKHPEKLEDVILPNQYLYVTVENTTSFYFGDSEEKGIEIESAIKRVIRTKLEITDIHSYEGPHEIRDDWMRCYIELIVPEDKRKINRKICKNISGVLLLTGFQAHTAHGKVISYELRNQPLDDFHRDEVHRTHSFYVITSIVDEPIIYLSSSNLGRDVVKYLRGEEVLSLPQIDFSDYVNALIEIVQNPLFIEICENQYRIKITDWLEDIKKEKYGAVPEGVVEHILRKIAYAVGVSGNGLQNFLDRLTTNDKNRRLFEETKSLIKALARNPRAHGSLERPKTDDKYFTILGMKAIRDIYLDRYFFESLNTCFKEMGKKTGDSFEELWKEYFEGRMYLFSWNDIIGNDSERFIEFLEKDLKINWVKNATIEKADDNKTIEVTDGKHLITFKLNREEKKGTRESPGEKTYGYILKEEGSKLNIYKKGKRGGLLVDYERKENTISFQINFKDKNFSFVVNLPEKQCQGGSIA